MQEVSKATIRKRKERERKKELEMVEVRIEFSKTELECLAGNMEFRGYEDRGEYLKALMRSDRNSCDEIKRHLNACGYCGNDLPKGCGGTFKGHGECFKTLNDKTYDWHKILRV